MFDQFRLKDVLVAYKQNFVAKQWGDEKYKWEAVKWFQDNWDVNAPDPGHPHEVGQAEDQCKKQYSKGLRVLLL